MLDRFLFKRIDNAPLLIFRIFFGFLISCECYGAIVTGWVRRTLIEPQFTFSFIGFEWLQPLPGNGMYYYFFLMGTLGLLIMLGYKYRFSMIAFTLLWTGSYLMQKTSYNNHYYLLILISGIMSFLPANRNYALDAYFNPKLKSNSMYSYAKWIIVAQLFIVYTYASVAKLYGDWFDFSVIKILMQSRAHYYVIGDFLQQEWVHKVIAVAGISFDLLIVPALLWKPTRKLAFAFSIFFHLFNSIVFQIGIFPYLSLAFIVFFFDAKTIKNIFFKKKTFYQSDAVTIPNYKKGFVLAMVVYFIIQIGLPLRHHFIPGDVLWTEEGHRLSWRMMLRSRSGTALYKMVDKKTGITTLVKLDDYLSSRQKQRVTCYPDFMWQFAQYLRKEQATKGKDVAVYVTSSVRVNNRSFIRFTDGSVDLASVPWRQFKHHDWILKQEAPETKK